MEGKKLGGNTGIFGQHQLCGLERGETAQSDVAGIADGGGKDIKTRRKFRPLKRFTLAGEGLKVGARRMI